MSGMDLYVSDDIEKLNYEYEIVLDFLLTPPHVKEQLRNTQSVEKKRQTVQLYESNFESAIAATRRSWGNRDSAIFHSLRTASVPDIGDVGKLRLGLQSANKEFMACFLGANGVAVLIRAMETEMRSSEFTEIDVAILYEVVACCKLVMNNQVGMEGFMAVTGAVDTIARSLRFEYRVYALAVLEILTVCCYYSDTAASLVVSGMRLLARSQSEAPFTCLARALSEQDIEVKSAVMQFVNAMVTGVTEADQGARLHSELDTVHIGECYNQAAMFLDSEVELLARIEQEAYDAGEACDRQHTAARAVPEVNTTLISTTTTSTTETSGGKLSAADVVREDQAEAVRRVSLLKRKSIKALYGPNALSEQMVESMLEITTDGGTRVREQDHSLYLQIKIGGRSGNMCVNPLFGTMAGLLTASKNTDKMEAKLVDLWGGKKTKRRWYEVDSEHFKWCSGHDKESTYKGVVPISTIVDIRNSTSDQNLLACNPFSFEVETSERVFALGCETLQDKERWLTAVRVSWNSSVICKGSYRSHVRELTTADLGRFAAVFKNQGALYHSVNTEAADSTRIKTSSTSNSNSIVQCAHASAARIVSVSGVEVTAQDLQELQLDGGNSVVV